MSENKPHVQKLDFRPVTRGEGRTQITLRDPLGRPLSWIEAGTLSVLRKPNSNGYGSEIGCRYREGVTDFEGDSAWAFRFGIIGLEFHTMENGWSFFHAWVRPDLDLDGFNVPSQVTLIEDIEGAIEKWPGTPHSPIQIPRFVPEGDIDLFRRVAGRRIDISFGPAPKDEE